MGERRLSTTPKIAKVEICSRCFETQHGVFTLPHCLCRCTVCRLEYEAGEEVLVLPCKHFYHPECIEQWLKQKKVCPQCNREVVESPGTTAAEAASGGAAR